MNQHQDMNSGLGSLTGTLGSLKDQARSKNLRSARISLVIAGIITLILGAANYFVGEKQFDDMIQKELRARTIDQEQVPEIKAAMMRMLTLLCGGLVGVGVIFLLFAILVRTFPLFCTVGGLILYIGYNLIMAYLISMEDGGNAALFLVSGWWWKLIIFIGLFKGIKSAVAYQRERAAIQEELGQVPASDI